MLSLLRALDMSSIAFQSAVRELRRGSALLLINEKYADAADPDELLRLPDILEALSGRESRLKGEPTIYQWQPEWLGGAPLIVRRCVHGGLWGRLAGGLFLSSQRMKREFAITLHAARSRVPTCEPVALRIERVAGRFLSAHYVTRKIENACDLLQLCRGILHEGFPSPCRKRLLLHAVAAVVARMHDAGILHADLNLRNLLVQDPWDKPQVHVIDFDKATLRRQPPLRARMGNLLRLERSALKWPESRLLVGSLDRLRLLRYYLARYPQWAGTWKEIARKYRRRHLLHLLSRKRASA